jgi:phosphoglucomutase
MKNYEKWHNDGYYDNITPVLQCSKKYEINIEELLEQVKFYKKYNVKTMCFSNNYLTADIAVNSKLKKFIDFLHDKIGIKWIHNLGAGWNLEDIRKWKGINFDSMDSVAYYTTKNAQEFGSLDPVENIKKIVETVGKPYFHGREW